MHIIAATHLLYCILADHTFSMPVCRIEYMNMGPMGFMEYLHAQEAEALIHYTSELNSKDQIPESLHEKLIDHMRIGALGDYRLLCANMHRTSRFHSVNRSSVSLLKRIEMFFHSTLTESTRKPCGWFGKYD